MDLSIRLGTVIADVGRQIDRYPWAVREEEQMRPEKKAKRVEVLRNADHMQEQASVSDVEASFRFIF